MDPNDFARLFRLDDVGQVLVTIEVHEETEMPAIRYRIPDAGGIGLTTTVSYNFREGVTFEKASELVFASLRDMTEDDVRDAVKDMAQMRTFILEDKVG